MELTKERDAMVKGKKEIKQRFDAADVYVADYVKVGEGEDELTTDYECGWEQGTGCGQGGEGSDVILFGSCSLTT